MSAACFARAVAVAMLLAPGMVASRQGPNGPIPHDDFQKAQSRLYEYAKQVSPGGPFHNKWIPMSAGGGTYEPPYVSASFSLSDGSGASGLVNLATGEVKDFQAHTTLVPSSLSPDVLDLATRAKEMLRKGGAPEGLKLFCAETSGPEPRELVFVDSEAYKYMIHLDSTTGKRVLTKADNVLEKCQKTLCSLGAQKPLRFPLIPQFDMKQRGLLWMVDGHGTEYEVFQDVDSGEIGSIEFIPHDTAHTMNPAVASRDEIAGVKRSLKDLGAGPYLLWKGVYGTKDSLSFSFAASKFGLPFFGFNGSLTIEKQTLRLISYQGPFFSSLPPINANRPVISEPALASKSKEIFDDWMKRLLASTGYPHTWEVRSPAELGYYLPEGAQEACLVWRQLAMITRHTPRADQGGSDGIYIDALTGERVTTHHAL